MLFTTLGDHSSLVEDIPFRRMCVVMSISVTSVVHNHLSSGLMILHHMPFIAAYFITMLGSLYVGLCPKKGWKQMSCWVGVG